MPRLVRQKTIACFGIFAGHQLFQQIEFPLGIDREIKLLDRFDRDFVRRKVERFRIAHVALGQPFDRRRHRGAEQQRLPRCGAAAQNPFDVGPKADVEHAIGFVEHDEFQVAERQRAAAHVIQHAAGRADDDLGAALQLFDLAADRLAAVQGDDMHLAAVRQLDRLFANLHGQLARRHQDQRLRRIAFVLLQAEPFQDRE